MLHLPVLTPDYLNRAKGIAAVLRPYGVKTYLSVNFLLRRLLAAYLQPTHWILP